MDGRSYDNRPDPGYTRGTGDRVRREAAAAAEQLAGEVLGRGTFSLCFGDNAQRKLGSEGFRGDRGVDREDGDHTGENNGDGGGHARVGERGEMEEEWARSGRQSMNVKLVVSESKVTRYKEPRFGGDVVRAEAR
jgi:hypothetical protein